MRSVHVTRRFPAPMVIRWVQNRLIRHQHGLLPATAFLNGPIPQGTPFRFHNPFTARAQCHEVGYQEPEHIPPLGVLQAHADNRGWRGVVLLNPQPDSAAVHLIALPQYGHLVSVALLVDNRIVPCCVPRRARWRDLKVLTFEGVRGRLDLPSHIDVVQDTVTFRSGDCFRVDTAADHTPASEFARLEEVDQEIAEVVIQDGPASDASRRRPVSWLGCLLCSIYCFRRVSASWWWTVGLSLSLAMHRPGSFPWQLPAHERSFHLSDSDEGVRVIYYSPFVGAFPPYQASPETDHSVAWAQFLNDDAAWAVDFFPVWPGLHFNAHAFVPVGDDTSTVTAILHYAGFARAVLMPRTVTDSWLRSFASHQVSADIDSIYLPHALEIWRFYDVPPPDCRLRNGDVLYLYDRDRQQEPLEFEGPWDIQTSGTGQHAPWAVGFRLDSETVVDLLRPGQRPASAIIPAGETWAPVQCTFSGDFNLLHPGMWTPVQWTASSTPQLIQAHGVAAYANVVVSTASGRRVRSVPRMVNRDALAACTGLHRSSITLGGVTTAALDAGVEIRNGDVVFGHSQERSAAPRSVRPSSRILLLLGWGPVLWRRGIPWSAVPSLLVVTSFALQAGIRDVRAMEAPSPDSDEARTIRTRLARSRSRSRQFFPSSRNGPESGPPIPISVWNPHPTRRDHCFGDFAPRGGGLQVRAICPFAGGSSSREVTHDAVWSVFADTGRSLCGRWPHGFFPGRGLGHRAGLTILPLSPTPLATVVLHRQGSARPFVVPESVTLAQIHLLSGNYDLGASPRSLISSPACGGRDPHAPLRVRNGDDFAYVPPFRDPEWCQVQWPRYRDPVEAMKCASWTIPFVIEWDGVARFWSTYSSSPQIVILREHTWWDPRQRTFCDFRGDRLGGTWIPVLHGSSEHLHMLDHAGVRAVHVMCVDYTRDDTSHHNAFLPGSYSHQPPHGWQWHPGLASLQPSSLRTGDVLVPDTSVEDRFDPWTQSIQQFMPPVVAGALARGRLWGVLILLSWLTPGVGAMQQPLPFSFNAFRVGRFPWRENDPDTTLALLSTQDSVDTVYLSPFSGPGPVLTLPATSSVADWSAALVQQDPAWGASACPVWPTVSAGAMIAVPRPPSLRLVCIHVTTHLEHFAICIPRVTTLAWLLSALRSSRALDVLSLRIPPALGLIPGDGLDEITWRTGDLVVALPPDAFTGLFQTPVFVRAEQVRHCAIWSLDFWLAAKADAVMWKPETRPLLTTVPRGSRWCALDSTFEGVFADRYPGIWTPVPWIAEDRPHLIQVSSSQHLVHVVVETPNACFCAAVHAHTERRRLWEDLPTLQYPPGVLSVPDEELDQGTTLRDGDIVVETLSSDTGGRHLQWGLLSLLLGTVGPLGFGWVPSCFPLVSLPGFARVRGRLPPSLDSFWYPPWPGRRTWTLLPECPS